MEKTNIAGVAKDTSIARIAVVGLAHSPGVAFRVFSLLGKGSYQCGRSHHPVHRPGRRARISASRCPGPTWRKPSVCWRSRRRALGFDHITVEDKIAKVSIVGAGMMTTPGVAAKMFEALYDANINIQMINTSEIRVSVLIDEEDAVAAVRAVHAKFFGEV